MNLAFLVSLRVFLDVFVVLGLLFALYRSRLYVRHTKECPLQSNQIHLLQKEHRIHVLWSSSMSVAVICNFLVRVYIKIGASA